VEGSSRHSCRGLGGEGSSCSWGDAARTAIACYSLFGGRVGCVGSHLGATPPSRSCVHGCYLCTHMVTTCTREQVEGAGLCLLKLPSQEGSSPLVRFAANTVLCCRSLAEGGGWVDSHLGATPLHRSCVEAVGATVHGVQPAHWSGCEGAGFAFCSTVLFCTLWDAVGWG